MPYSNFKSLDEIKAKFGISVVSSGSLFSGIEEIIVSDTLTAILQENVSLALNINTEKARSEFIIAPLLLEVRKLLNRQCSLFSGIDFNIDESVGLNGFCDFILSKSSDQVFLEAPVLCIVEAKNENIKSAYAQCSAEMIAAQLFNQAKQQQTDIIYGLVTTGSNWKFLQLQNNILSIDYDEYLISQNAKILAILLYILRE